MNGKTDSGLVQITDPPKDLPVIEYDKSKEELPGSANEKVGNPGGLDKDRGAVVRVGRIISATKDTLRTDCMLLAVIRADRCLILTAW